MKILDSMNIGEITEAAKDAGDNTVEITGNSLAMLMGAYQYMFRDNAELREQLRLYKMEIGKRFNERSGSL